MEFKEINVQEEEEDIIQQIDHDWSSWKMVDEISMDIFDVLTAISKRKMAFMHTDMNENEALIKAEFEISKEYHIPLLDIKKLLGVRFISTGLVENRNKDLGINSGE